jgi:hypothetical protein
LLVAAGLDGDAAGVDAGNPGAGERAYAQGDQLFLGLGGKIRGKQRQHPVLALDQQDLGIRGIDAAEIVAQGVVGDFAQGAGELHTSRPAADNHEGQPRAAFLEVRFALGALEGGQHAAADFGGVLDRLEPGRKRRPLVVAEVVVGGASGDNQVVVGRLTVAQYDAAAFRVEIDHFAEQHLGVRVCAEHHAKRRCDFTG